MPACEQISLEVKEAPQPIVHELAKQNVLSLSKEIIPATVKKSMFDFASL